MITNQKVLEHFFHPYHVGEVDVAVTGVAGTAGHGDMIQLQLVIDANEQHIQQAYFKAYGCPYTIAICSLLMKMLENKTVAAAKSIEHTELALALELPDNKLSSSILAIKALRYAIRQYEENNE